MDALKLKLAALHKRSDDAHGRQADGKYRGEIDFGDLANLAGDALELAGEFSASNDEARALITTLRTKLTEQAQKVEDLERKLYATQFQQDCNRGALRRDDVIHAVCGALGEALDCTRVWSAWQVGTMSQNDFSQVADDPDRVAEIADAAIAAMIAPQAVGASLAAAGVVL